MGNWKIQKNLASTYLNYDDLTSFLWQKVDSFQVQTGKFNKQVIALFGILLFIILYSLWYYKVFSQRLLTQLIELNEIILQWGSVNKPRTIDGPFSERFFNLDDFISHPWGDPIIGKKYNYLRSYH